MPLPGAPHFKVPSHQKRRQSQQQDVYEQTNSCPPYGLPRGAEEVYGGFVDSRVPVLYSDWMKLESLDIGML